MKVTTGDKNHLKDLAKLFNQYRIFYKMPSDILSATTFIQARLSACDSIIFLCHLNQDAVGFCQIYPSFSSVAMQPIWVLNDLYVTENARRAGCARNLLKHIDGQAREAGIFSIQLATAVDNYNAKDLYHSLGYKEITQFQHFSKKVI